MTFLEQRLSTAPVEGYEIYRIRSRELSIESKEGEVELSHEAVSCGIALQLFSGGRVGFASSSVETADGMNRMIESAFASLDVVAAGIPCSLPSRRVGDLHIDYEEGLKNRPFREKADLAKQLEEKARCFDRRITRVRSARYHELEEEVALKNSKGFLGDYKKTICELSLMAMAEESGHQEMAWDSDFSPFFQKLDPDCTAERAAEKAVSLLGAKPIASCKAPALLDPQVAASLLGVFSQSFFGDQVIKGKSRLKGRLGEMVSSEKISLIDDGTQKGGYGSAPFDGEGVESRRTTLIQGGRLLNYLQNNESATRLKLDLTGNAIRPGYKERPRVGATNIFIEPGPFSTDKLVQEMGRGFWVTDLIGVHTADPVSGDFSLGAAGYWVEKGERKPVRGVAVSGNLHDLLKKTIAVGSELRFYDSYGSPPLLISEIDIGGA